MQKTRRFVWPAAGFLTGLFIAAAVGTYVWYILFRPCHVSIVEEASTILFSQLNRYEDVYQVAISATPSTVVLPVSVLQQILMDTQQVDVPACMQTAKNELVDYMRTIIRAFDAYGAREPDAKVRDLINEAVTHLYKFDTELEAVKECAPYCWP